MAPDPPVAVTSAEIVRSSVAALPPAVRMRLPPLAFVTAPLIVNGLAVDSCRVPPPLVSVESRILTPVVPPSVPTVSPPVWAIRRLPVSVLAAITALASPVSSVSLVPMPFIAVNNNCDAVRSMSASITDSSIDPAEFTVTRFPVAVINPTRTSPAPVVDRTMFPFPPAVTSFAVSVPLFTLNVMDPNVACACTNVDRPCAVTVISPAPVLRLLYCDATLLEKDTEPFVLSAETSAAKRFIAVLLPIPLVASRCTTGACICPPPLMLPPAACA